MKITHEKIKEDANRDLYWTKVFVESDDKMSQSVLLTCASWEYMLDKNRANNVTEKFLNDWIDEVVSKTKKSGNNFFRNKINYDVYANTKDGKINGLEFLKEIRV